MKNDWQDRFHGFIAGNDFDVFDEEIDSGAMLDNCRQIAANRLKFIAGRVKLRIDEFTLTVGNLAWILSLWNPF